MVKRIQSLPVALIVLVGSAAVATARMPPNPDRLASVVDCRSALKELVRAAQPSPLRSAEENKRYLDDVAQRADRLCMDAPQPGEKPRP
jgi:hypothetical protein